jgi:MerR family transcriptional regulator/heat shock protein HspR
MTDEESRPRYVISVAAQIVGIEAHTLRYYERLGLIQPERSSGNIRLYSEDDIERLRHIKALMSDCGVNLAGVEVALRLMQKMKEMQREIEEMERKIKGIAVTEMADTMKDTMRDIVEDVE